MSCQLCTWIYNPLEGCVTLSHVNHARLVTLGLPYFPRALCPITKCSRSGQTMISTAQGPEGRPVGQSNSGKPLCAPSLREAWRRNSSFWSGSSRVGRRRELQGRASPEEGGGGRRARPAHLGSGASAPAPLPSAPGRMNGPERKVRGSLTGGSGGGEATPGAAPCSRVLEAGTRRRQSRTPHGRSPAPVGGAAGDASHRRCRRGVCPAPLSAARLRRGLCSAVPGAPKPRSQPFRWCRDNPRGTFCADIPGEE